RRGGGRDLADRVGANGGIARRSGGGAERGEGRRPRPGQGGHPAETRGRPRPAAAAAAAEGCDGGWSCRGGGGGARGMNLAIEAALRLRWVVLLLTAGLVALGAWAYTQQQIDAYPDISAQMVQIITVYPGRAPEEVERQVTIPVENAMLATPRVETVRSRTIFGLSLVQLMFEEGTEAYWARQRVAEKLGEIDLPEGVKPQLGPLATAYGEIYRYELVSDGTHDLIELRTLNDWVVTRRLKRVPGVAEVANFGGYQKQFAITFNRAQ